VDDEEDTDEVQKGTTDKKETRRESETRKEEAVKEEADNEEPLSPPLGRCTTEEDQCAQSSQCSPL